MHNVKIKRTRAQPKVYIQTKEIKIELS